MSSNTLRWGIVGCGLIGTYFAKDIVNLNKHPRGPHHIEHVITRVGSRSAAKGEQFIKLYIPENHGAKAVSYDEIIVDPEVDILYIGLPHTMHHTFAVDAMRKGKKHVLCEKPVTVNAGELREIINTASENNVFFLEAMWVRYFPLVLAVQRALYEERVIGDVKRVVTNLSVDMAAIHGDDWVPSNRVADKKLGGGALLDITIYPLTFSRLFMDPLADIKTDWKVVSSMVFESLTGKKEDEVDFCTSYIITDQKHKQQSIGLSSFFNKVADKAIARIDGTLGTLNVYSSGGGACPIWYSVELKNGQKHTHSFEDDLGGAEGYIYEAVECGERILAGETESPVMPWLESLAIMELMDAMRKENHLVYDADHKIYE